MMKTPASLKSLFKSQRSFRPWPNPKESIGNPKPFITLRKGYSCWEAIGPASKLFEEELAPAAIGYLDSCLVSDTYAVQLSLYMIGKTEDSAAPHLFIICMDKATRQNARELLDESLIMQDERFAGFRLGVSAVAPGEPALRRSIPMRYADGKVPSNDIKTSDTAVYLPSSSHFLRPGTTIFVSGAVGDAKVQPIRATVGLVLYSETKRYLLTARHPFEPLSTEAPSTSTSDDPQVSDPEDLECDFDGLSDTEEEPFSEGEEDMLSIASRSSDDGLDNGDVSIHSSLSGEDTSSSSLQSPVQPIALVPDSPESGISLSLQTPNETKLHYPVPLLSPNDVIGKLALSGSKDGLDYGLVEVTNDELFATNRFFLPPAGAPRLLGISSTGSLDLKSPVDVVAVTSSPVLLDGKLEPTPTYIRLPGSTHLEKVYIARLNGILGKGDCGAVVVDSSSGSFYGHIIGGSLGTGIAYVISGEAIFADLETRHRKKVTYSPRLRESSQTGGRDERRAYLPISNALEQQPIETPRWMTAASIMSTDTPQRQPEDHSRERSSVPRIPPEPASAIHALHVDNSRYNDSDENFPFFDAGGPAKASNELSVYWPFDEWFQPSGSGTNDLYHRRSQQMLANRSSLVSRFHANPGSLSSTSSFSQRSSGSYGSFGLSIASSATSYSEWFSPSALSPSTETELGPLSPFLAANQSGSLSRLSHQRGPAETEPLNRKLSSDSLIHSRYNSVSRLYICECCPKKPKKFESKDELLNHELEKQYTCAFCSCRFKSKNEAERHHNSLHLRRYSWSCAALKGPHAAFHQSTAYPGAADICGYCGREFTNPPDWDERNNHLNYIHKFGECNQTKKFFRADHFRQHLKHSHASSSGRWINILENACINDEPPPTIRLPRNPLTDAFNGAISSSSTGIDSTSYNPSVINEAHDET